MRLWSLHPRYLDRQGLLAVWREGLLAQKVLTGTTKGYRQHPQLQRFRESSDPLAAIGAYLTALVDEAVARGYQFDREKILRPGPSALIAVTSGQVDYEWQHLGRKLELRDPARLSALIVTTLELHPLFILVPGPVAAWEVGAGSSPRSKPNPPRSPFVKGGS